MSTASSVRGPQAANDEASRWVVRASGQTLDAQTQAEFDAWYQADPSHAAAYDRLARVWRRMGEIDRGKLAPPRPARKRRTVLALALLAATGIAWHTLRDFHPGADYASGAEVLRVALPDGSTAVLDAHSAIAVDFGPDKREVRLLAGQALFNAAPRVADGPAFTVATPDASASALGTRYTVAREPAGTRITVYQHRVAVQCLACADGQSLILDPGQEATVSPAGILRGDAPKENAPGWSQGLLAFNNALLPDAAAQLARYTGKHIVVMGDAARRTRVSGTANIANPKRALDLLLAQTPVRITDLPGLLILR
ncbi:Protein FecR [Achromobacter deleyi]|uniref:Protein FecR n=1 Tax=Achromobacter deleyi TaxID=1353891 RepID=A0A6S7ABA0_9BURK|nr:FecR domain-containing protein [Achromobacter deleyi]CAB3717621.1 Protein FecR [Achromobacter deleyi]CAB3845781.1 Protein FecR [Achromobacter deleyi]CAB3852832.1 Protein FecR [Achromobacter deleyi]